MIGRCRDPRGGCPERAGQAVRRLQPSLADRLFHPIGPIQHFLNGIVARPSGPRRRDRRADRSMSVSIVARPDRPARRGRRLDGPRRPRDGRRRLDRSRRLHRGRRERRSRATVHGTLMIITLVLYLVSLGIRAGSPPDRLVPIASPSSPTSSWRVSSRSAATSSTWSGRTSTATPGEERARSGSPSISADSRTSPRAARRSSASGSMSSPSSATAKGSSRSTPSAPMPAVRWPRAARRRPDPVPWHGSRFRLENGHVSPRACDVRPARLRGPPCRGRRLGGPSRLPLNRPAGAPAPSGRVQYDSDEPGADDTRPSA